MLKYAKAMVIMILLCKRGEFLMLHIISPITYHITYHTYKYSNGTQRQYFEVHPVEYDANGNEHEGKPRYTH